MMHKFTDNEEKFLQALENSRLRKTFSVLLDFDTKGECSGHCALGCALLAFHPNANTEEGARAVFGSSWTFRSAWTSDELRRTFAVSTGFNQPLLYGGELFYHITQLNDNTDLTLPEIAKLLRENPKIWANHG